MDYHRQYGYTCILIHMFSIGFPLTFFQVQWAAATEQTVCMYTFESYFNSFKCNVDISCGDRKIKIINVLYKSVQWAYQTCNGYKYCTIYCCLNVYGENADFRNLVTETCDTKSSCTVMELWHGMNWKAKVAYTCIDMPTTTLPTSTTTSSNTATESTTPTFIIYSTSATSTMEYSSGMKSEHKDDFPTAAAVSVPLVLIVVGVIVVAVIYILRKRRTNKNVDRIDNRFDTSNSNDHTMMADSNMAYTDCATNDNNDNIINPKTHKPRTLSGSADSEYVEITNGADEKNNGEYNTINFQQDSFPVETGYDHLPKQEHITDNTYSHIKGAQSQVQGVDATYSHIKGDQSVFHGVDTTYANITRKNVLNLETINGPFSSDDNDLTYNTLQTNTVKTMGPKTALNPQDKDDKYNHTNVAWSALYHKDQYFQEAYAICDQTIGAWHGMPTNIQAKRNGKKNDEVKNDVPHEDEYACVCEMGKGGTIDERTETNDNSGDHYFVLQKEETDEDTDTGPHNYFVLEKNTLP